MFVSAVHLLRFIPRCPHLFLQPRCALSSAYVRCIAARELLKSHISESVVVGRSIFFPVLIMLLVPFREHVMPKLFEPDHLIALDPMDDEDPTELLLKTEARSSNTVTSRAASQSKSPDLTDVLGQKFKGGVMAMYPQGRGGSRGTDSAKVKEVVDAKVSGAGASILSYLHELSFSVRTASFTKLTSVAFAYQRWQVALSLKTKLNR